MALDLVAKAGQKALACASTRRLQQQFADCGAGDGRWSGV
jgi:hypothetical protein